MNEHTLRKRRPALGLTLLAAACAAGGGANARETPQDGASRMLDEIVVTARMREESLQLSLIHI